MNYTLNQLRIFSKIAELASITKAAEELHLTQPAVSIQLKNFQDQFDVPLTEVVGRKLYVTEFGKEIAAAAQNILLQVDNINNKLLAYKGQLIGRLTISVVSTGKYVMPFFLSGFIQRHEGIELVMDVTNKTKVVESLENNEVDFALVSILPEHLAVNKVDLLDNILYLVGNDKPILRQGASAKNIFEWLPLIYREPGSGTRQTMERFIESLHVPAKKKLELTSNEAVKQAVLAGLGYSVMPLIGIKNELDKEDLQIIPIKGLPIKTMWSLIWLKGKKLSPAAEAFLAYIEEEKEQIKQMSFNWIGKYNKSVK